MLPALSALNFVLLAVIAVALLQRRAERRWLERVRLSLRRYARGDDQRLGTGGAPGALAPLAEALDDLVRALGEEARGMQSELRLEQEMARKTPNGLVLVDEVGHVKVANPAARVLVPVRAEPVGKAPIESFPVPELQEVVDECRETGVVAERSLLYGGRDLVVRGVPLEAGRGVLGVILDITTVRQAERARRDFVSNVSHELRTPITVILGYAEALSAEEMPEGCKPMVATIERNSRRLHALVDDVLHLSRIEARGQNLPCIRQPLGPLVDEVAARFGPTLEAGGGSLVVELPPDLAASVNDEAFTHALGNLVDNAIKYGGAQGRVTILGRAEAERVDVSVSDEGPGIEPVHHSRLFERFYRVDPGRSRDVGGTGLGLALVKHLCLAMEAQVGVESAPGRGSTFTIRLKAEAEEEVVY